jgi:triacylglycerol lipase
MAKHLGARGFATHAIDLVPNDGSAEIPALAAQLAAFIECVVPSGADLDLVGFSMGGVVSRYYLQRLGGRERVRRFVSISSPHHGTVTAYLSRLAGARQLRPDSALLAELNADLGALATVEVTTLWTPLDLMIVPADSSRLPLGREVLVAAPLHVLMLHDPRAIRAVTDALAAPLAPPASRTPDEAA